MAVGEQLTVSGVSDCPEEMSGIGTATSAATVAAAMVTSNAGLMTATTVATVSGVAVAPADSVGAGIVAMGGDTGAAEITVPVASVGLG